MDRLGSMLVFIRAVEAGSFAAAAGELDMSAPMVGKHVRFLEERMGVALLARTTRRQFLTEAGRIYYDHCRSILAEVETAEVLTAEHSSIPRGRLRVTMPTVLGRHTVAPLLLEMAAAWPDMTLSLDFSDEVIDLGGCDLAVRSVPSYQELIAAESGLATRRLCTHEMVVCGSPKYLDCEGMPASWKDLYKHRTLAFGRSERRLSWTFLAEDGSLSNFEPKGSVTMNDLEALTDAAVQGLGLVWLPSWLARAREKTGELTVVPLQGSARYNNYAMWHEGAVTPKVRVALDALIEELPKLMGTDPTQARQ